MTEKANDIVCVTSGSLMQVECWHGLLQNAGIECKVLGDNLTAGLGTALPGSVELWVHAADVGEARAVLAEADGRHPRGPDTHPVPKFGHPVSDPKPDHSRGPQHGAPPHRPLPS
jgi:hypothetical protein